LSIAVPAYAQQEQHDQQEGLKARSAKKSATRNWNLGSQSRVPALLHLWLRNIGKTNAPQL